ncbi:GAK system CofD-like protein [Maridesulfovibrio bastinii]|uniref:GAK system CofD-like protein n=1 Tax=Maridesulfovibrio bastinii TaxID=47157 RepID=UPI000419EB7B|nr:GAK system CofD-like protein [Maridesulfovibrio bastinii]
MENLRVERADGPGVLFFSGGTALAGLASELVRYTSNSMHIITTFDSGGSSAKLRTAFKMPAVGDIRNRLLSLSDNSSDKCDAVIRLFKYRLAHNGSQEELKIELESLASEQHPLMLDINQGVRRVVARQFLYFLNLMPDSFDLRGACLGNLALASGYLVHKRILAPSIAQFARYSCSRGMVRACSFEYGHLAVRLKNGEVIAGQHLFSGKENIPVKSPIDGMWICAEVNDPWPKVVYASSIAMMLIMEADLIVYPMGSFYSSLLASLLPKDIGHSISSNPAPKIFIPNMGYDPELKGHSVALQVERLLEVLRADNPSGISVDSVLDAVLVDTENGCYENGLELEKIEARGIKIIDKRLVESECSELVDPVLLAEILLDFTRNGLPD